MNDSFAAKGSASPYLAVATPECVADDFGGEIVVLNLESGLYFSLRDLAAGLWRDLASGQAVESLLAELRQADPALADAAGAFIRDLVERGLLRPAATPAAVTPSLESLAQVQAGEVALTFEAYEDMKDLVLADPIHDSDEGFGWPVRRQEA